MKIILCFVSFIFVFSSTASADPFTATLAVMKADIAYARAQAHYVFIENEWVKSARSMYQNYRESKQFYADMRRISAHKGGLAGYLEDEIMNELQAQSNDELYALYNFAESDNPKDSFVNKNLIALDKKLAARVDYTKQIRSIGKKHDKEIEDIYLKYKKDTLSDEENERLRRQIDLLSIRLANETNKNILLLFNDQTMNHQEELDAIRRQVESEVHYRRTVTQMYKDRAKAKATKSPAQVLQEIPR